MHDALRRQLRPLGVHTQAQWDQLCADAAAFAARSDAPASLRSLLGSLGEFVRRVEETYAQADRDLSLRSRSLAQSSEELIETNRRLRDELERRDRAIESLHLLARSLVDPLREPNAGGSRLAEDAAAVNDLDALSTVVGRLAKDLNADRAELASLQAAVDNHCIVSVTDPQGVITYVNDAFCQSCGHAREELIGRQHDVVSSGVHPREFFADLWETISAGMVWRGEICNRRKNGQRYWLLCTITPVFDAEGRIAKYVAIRTDITERRRMAQQLQRSEYHYRSVVDSLRETVLRTDLEGRLTFLNPSWETATGHRIADSLGRPMEDFIHPDDRPAAEHVMGRVLSGEAQASDGELRVVTSEGGVRWMEARVQRVHGAEGRPEGLVGALNDITERRLAVDRLKEQLELVDAVLEGVPLPLFMKTLDRRYSHVNRAFLAMAKLPLEAVVGHTTVEVMGYAPSAQTVAEEDALFAGGTPVRREVRLRLRGGHWIDCLLTKAPLHGADGRVIGIVGVCLDITDQKQAQLALHAAKDAAESANRLKSEFLANMSHEIRTPMNGVVGMTELALGLARDKQQREFLEIARSSALSLLTVINDILDFSKIEAGKLAIEHIPFDVHRLLLEVLRTVSPGPAANAHVELGFELRPEVPSRLVGDPGRLRQIVSNVVGNAVKFTRSGEVVVTVGTVSQDTPPGVRLCIEVRDTGIGIPKDKLAHIFEPFAQEDGSITRRFGGTGLGLTITRRLCEMLGGTIAVRSTPGEGSVFAIELPFALDSFQHAAVAPASPLDGCEVLLLERHPTARAIEQRALQQLGCVPLAAGDCDTALTLLASRPVHAVLLDLASDPDRHVLTRVQAMRSTGRKLPLVVTTPPGDPAEGGAARAGADGVLMKPVSRHEIEAALRQGFEGGAPATASAQRPRLSSAGRGQRVLVVEDHDVNQHLLRTLLHDWGYAVAVAENGQRAVERHTAKPYDIVLMDMHMPVMSGLEATAAIRRHDVANGRHTPIIALTASAMAGDRERCLEAGMDDYLTKPLNRSALLQMLLRYAPNAGSAAARGEAYARSVARANPQTLAIIAGPFVDHYPKDLAGMRHAIEHGQRDTLARLAHTLKGLLLGFEARPAAELASRLQTLARSEAWDADAAREVLVQLQADLAMLRPHLLRAASHEIWADSRLR